MTRTKPKNLAMTGGKKSGNAWKIKNFVAIQKFFALNLPGLQHLAGFIV